MCSGLYCWNYSCNICYCYWCVYLQGLKCICYKIPTMTFYSSGLVTAVVIIVVCWKNKRVGEYLFD